MEIGTKTCITCKEDWFSVGSSTECPKCLDEYYRNREKENPYVVHFGSDHEDFATEKDAEKFLDELRSAYIEKRN